VPTIDSFNIRSLSADHFSSRPAGATAIIVTSGVVLDEKLAGPIPLETTLWPLTSVGDVHVYKLTIRGYTVQHFIDIAMAFANMKFDEAEELIKQLKPIESGW
jgi:hypothetical protein